MTTLYIDSATVLASRARRREALISLAKAIAGRARRARRQDVLDRVRSIGAQLDALDLATTEARDFLNAALPQLVANSEALDV